MASKLPKNHSSLLLKPHNLLLFFLLCLFLLHLFTLHPHNSPNYKTPPNSKLCNTTKVAPFYIYPLPTQFNHHLLLNCRRLNVYTDMCPHVANRGLGRPLNSTWHATHQFIAEMIFHARAEMHPCRTYDAGVAELFYVPFYAGLYASSVFREGNYTARDGLGVELGAYVAGGPHWGRSGGKDHFMVVGRTAWDFMRVVVEEDEDKREGDFGANRMLLLPTIKNMSILTVERHPWQGHNQYGIPYPSYFHPLTRAEVANWQESIRRAQRTHLFSFVGGPRVGLEKAAVRSTILHQCGQSSRCIRVECEPGSSNCHEPDRVLEVMKRSVFCMQPPGDSFTRRSMFDSVLAGCIPVFFSEHTAYTQYAWYFPAQREEWSVFIEPDRWDQIEEELDRIPKMEVETMRERLIRLIPKVTYMHPNVSAGEVVEFGDAVDVALMGLTRHVRSMVVEA